MKMTKNMEIAERAVATKSNSIALPSLQQTKVQNIFHIIEEFIFSPPLTNMLFVSFVPCKTIENQNKVQITSSLKEYSFAEKHLFVQKLNG